jgi:hypothetical protein
MRYHQPIITMSLQSEIKAIAVKFQVDNNLDRTEIPNLLQHDYIHATLGLGVTTAEEELVEYIENHLSFGLYWNAEGNRLAATLNPEFRALYN